MFSLIVLGVMVGTLDNMLGTRSLFAQNRYKMMLDAYNAEKQQRRENHTKDDAPDTAIPDISDLNRFDPPADSPPNPSQVETVPRQQEPRQQTPPQNQSWPQAESQLSFSQQSVSADEASIRRGLLWERQNDARLNDVVFATPELGWAVGDCGAIWHTQDGGRHWTIQESGTDVSLLCIDFIDAQNGFAAGGSIEPYTHCGRGIVLRTANGGQTWERLTTFLFPVLTRIHLVSPGTLWAAGNASESCPTGLLLSSNNGQTWDVMPGGKNEGWKAFELLTPQQAAGIGLDGSIQTIRDTIPVLSTVPPLALRRANAMSLFLPRVFPDSDRATPVPNGWLVGDGGVIVCSQDGGVTWEIPRNFPPLKRPDLFDFQTVFALDGNVWLAGNPGTLIFYSNDSGTTWQAAKTDIATPIRKIRFVTPECGFAVGDLGTILATTDGGRRWSVQRAGGRRLAVLGVLGRAQDVPYETMAQLCLEEGFLGGVDVLFRQDSLRNDGKEIPVMRRLHEAVVRCGGSVTMQPWAFPIDHDEITISVDQIVGRVESENGGHGLARFRENLVATIRTWRPDVILTSGDSKNSDDPVGEFVQREILQAVQAAADPAMYPEQLAETGLQPWQVSKVHARCDKSGFGNIQIPTQVLALRSGQMIDDTANAARSLVMDDQKMDDQKFAIQQTVQQTMLFRTLYDVNAVRQRRDPAEINRNGSLMSGLSLPNGCEARRTFQNISMIKYYETLQRQWQTRNTLKSLVSGIGKFGDDNRYMAQVENLAKTLDQNAAVQTLLEMGNRLDRAGNRGTAARLYQQAAFTAPRHPLAKLADRWLLQYFGGSDDDENDSQPVVPVSDGQIQTASRFSRMTTLAGYVQQLRPELLLDPDVRFCLAAAQRENGQEAAAMQYYRMRSAPPNDDIWAVRAAGEAWAMNAKTANPNTLDMGKSPLPVIVCHTAGQHPWLDGKFDEPAWSECTPVIFTPLEDRNTGRFQGVKSPSRIHREQSNTPSKPFGTEAMFLHDDEFLYVGLKCPKADGFSYRQTDTPRFRDPDLRKEDRIELLLDTKRNYTIYHMFTLDHRGWVAESRRHDASWNPEWFVAHREDEKSWFIEAAIPLKNLVGQPQQTQRPGEHLIWGIALRRLVPGVGVECWNAGLSWNTVEGFGYLFFE
ncbi:MAG: YCF48-related protein [Planctomycetaceae bacterium]|nr:YCF48-related protein [Planctomycetaceae bacterium]